MALNPAQNRRLHQLVNQLGITPEQKAAAVFSFTNQRTASTTEMSYHEGQLMITWLLEMSPTGGDEGDGEAYATQLKQKAACDRMRKKILSCCHQMGWYLREENSRETGPGRLILKYGKPQLDYDHINSFCQVKSPHKKALMLHTYKELTELVTVFENVLKSTVKKAA